MRRGGKIVTVAVRAVGGGCSAEETLVVWERVGLNHTVRAAASTFAFARCEALRKWAAAHRRSTFHACLFALARRNVTDCRMSRNVSQRGELGAFARPVALRYASDAERAEAH